MLSLLQSSDNKHYILVYKLLANHNKYYIIILNAKISFFVCPSFTQQLTNTLTFCIEIFVRLWSVISHFLFQNADNLRTKTNMFNTLSFICLLSNRSFFFALKSSECLTAAQRSPARVRYRVKACKFQWVFRKDTFRRE